MNLQLLIDVYFNSDVFYRYLPSILAGMLVTLEISVAVVLTGLVLGAVLAVIRSYHIAPLNFLIVVFVDILRAVPPLVVILILYFGLPSAGVFIPSFAVIWITLSLVLAAFAEEIFWAGIIAVPKGQWDAAASTGLSFTRSLIHVVLPQALRITVPPLTNRTIAITKNSALASVVGVPEILNQATTAQSFSANATPLVMAAIAYLIIFIPVVMLGRNLEKHFHWGRNP